MAVTHAQGATEVAVNPARWLPPRLRGPRHSLDAPNIDIMKLLNDAADTTGKRILIVLHDINLASTYADEIVAVENGRIHTHGTAAEVMQPEVLSALYGSPGAAEEIHRQQIGVYYR